MRDVNWPALCAGLIVGGYWARVLRMVLKARRRTGRAANFLPAEPLGRALRLAWVPIVCLWIALPLSGAFYDAKAPYALRRLYQWPAIEWAGVVVAAAALAATLACWRRMGKSWRMGIDPDERTPLVVSGPYAYVRHPIYALSALLVLATVVVVPSPAMIAVALVHVALLAWEARREERHLVAVHGADYEAYTRRVGRFAPRSLSAYAPAPGANDAPGPSRT